MKKIMFASALFFSFSFISCKKDYTCDCSASGGDISTYDNLSKDNAEVFQTNCESQGCNWSQK